MASITKNTRRGSSRGFETVILKDLQCLQNWNLGQLQTYRLGRDYTSTTASDCDHLLCDETLDDLDDVWATPLKPKQPKKTKTKVGSRLKSPDTYDLWATPAKPQRNKKCKTKVGSRLKSPETHGRFSPASHLVVPPNSPADFTGTTEQTQSNPYITFLMHSWDEVQTRTEQLVSAHTRKTTASSFPILSNSAIIDQDNMLLLHSNDSFLISTSPMPDQLAASSAQNTESSHSETEDQVAMIQSDDVVVAPYNTDITEEVPAFVHLHSDDILVIPDSTAEEGASAFAQHSIQQSATDTGDEQCVPEESLVQCGQTQSYRSQDFNEYFLFVEDDFLPPALTAQPTPCSLDHVVPRFHVEE